MATITQSGYARSGFGASPHSVTIPFTPVTGRKLIIELRSQGAAGPISGIVDNQSNSFSSDYSPAGLTQERHYYSTGVLTGTMPTSITITSSASTGRWAVGFFEVGEDVSFVRGASGTPAFGRTHHLDIATDSANDIVVGGVYFSGASPAAIADMTLVGGITNVTHSPDYMANASFYNDSPGAAGTKTLGYEWLVENGGSSASDMSAVVYAPAASAATLSSPTSASVTQTGATIGATTDDATGTLYGVVTTSATAPSATQIKAGQDHAGSAAAGSGSNASLSVGANTIAITGLTAATTYYYYLVQDNGADSNVVNGTFTTAVAAPVISVFTILNEDADGFDIRFTTDTGNGTAYYVVYPTSASDPNATQIVAGTDGDAGAALASGNMAVSATGVQTFPSVNGLSSGVTYRVAVVHYGVPA